MRSTGAQGDAVLSFSLLSLLSPLTSLPPRSPHPANKSKLRTLLGKRIRQDSGPEEESGKVHVLKFDVDCGLLQSWWGTFLHQDKRSCMSLNRAIQ